MNPSCQFFFPFVFCALGVVSKKALLSSRSQRFIPMFSYMNFITLALKFRSIIPFEFLCMVCGKHSN